MNWFLYTLAAWITLNVLISVAAVGKPRDPLTPAVAAAMVALNLGIVAGLLMAAVRIG